MYFYSEWPLFLLKKEEKLFFPLVREGGGGGEQCGMGISTFKKTAETFFQLRLNSFLILLET
jgi:hypothetical protein